MHTSTAYRSLQTINKAEITDPSEKNEVEADQVTEETEQDADDEEAEDPPRSSATTMVS